MNQVKGWNIELSTSQFDYLCEVLMDANDDNKIIGRGWDIQTFDNLIDNVCAAKETYLSNNVILSCILLLALTLLKISVTTVVLPFTPDKL